MEKEKDKTGSLDGKCGTLIGTMVFICFGIYLGIMSMYFYHCYNPDWPINSVKLNYADKVEDTVKSRISRSIQGLPPLLTPASEGSETAKNIQKRNSLANLDPIYLQDKHKSGSKRRFKKVLESSDYWKFQNGKEEMIESKDELITFTKE